MPTKQANTVIIALGYVFAEEVLSFVQNLNNVSVNLAPGADWKPVYWQPRTGTFDQTPEETPAGTAYNQTVTCTVPGMEEVQQLTIEQLNQRKLILKLSYDNGMDIIVGSPDVPAFVQANLSAQNFAQKNALSFTCRAAKPARFVS